ncbi:hypothetical protein ACFRCI_39185 [Streptomyces sp. NPDC056638]|uniref:hypothetical protein n=1 Tax=Streptomyces sp. NPDC056638 TaxID=3345887 RepID=UPI0036B25D84
MIRPITDEPVRRLVEQAEADRIDRPKGTALPSAADPKCDPDHLLPLVCAEDGREVNVVE